MQDIFISYYNNLRFLLNNKDQKIDQKNIGILPHNIWLLLFNNISYFDLYVLKFICKDLKSLIYKSDRYRLLDTLSRFIFDNKLPSTWFCKYYLRANTSTTGSTKSDMKSYLPLFERYIYYMPEYMKPDSYVEIVNPLYMYLIDNNMYYYNNTIRISDRSHQSKQFYDLLLIYIPIKYISIDLISNDSIDIHLGDYFNLKKFITDINYIKEIKSIAKSTNNILNQTICQPL